MPSTPYSVCVYSVYYMGSTDCRLVVKCVFLTSSAVTGPWFGCERANKPLVEARKFARVEALRRAWGQGPRGVTDTHWSVGPGIPL
ncbi:hypothetical protein VTH82DRAFT_4425 [Thermothelomyces myriococcoides]